MSMRLLTHRLFKNGRFLLKSLYKREIHTNIVESGGKKRVVLNPNNDPSRLKRATQLNTGLLRFGQHARRLFIDNILNRVTTTQSADLRAEVTKKFFHGNSTPFFALVGVGLASGNGLLTKDDELEGVCWEIREAVTHIQSLWNGDDITKKMNDDFGLDDLKIGPPIDKGCAAVVYSASLKNPEKYKTTVAEIATASSPTNFGQSFRLHHNFSPVSNLEGSYYGGSVDNLNLGRRDFDGVAAFRDRMNSNSSVLSSSSSFASIAPRQRVTSISESLDDFEMNRVEFDESKENSPLHSMSPSTLVEYPFALKMMFNYDIQSNALSILRAMQRETVPARRRNNPSSDNWEHSLSNQMVNLPAHPNIVLMFGVFCAQIPNLAYSQSLYPMALPTRLNPSGYGRNMSLFLLMKRYNCSLRDFLLQNGMDTRTAILLFAQLLEAAVHLHRYGVSHRDLKSDNILVDTNGDESAPILVLSDFGCCLADKSKGLRLPYPSIEIDKGGNPALMAPEIISKEPGTFSILNYSKSDLWTCGTIAYEIFGHTNPFYNAGLKNTDYKDGDLPPLSGHVPLIIRKLVENILSKNPNDRLNPDVAANVIQLYLWAPSSWLKLGSMPTSAEILQWLLSLTTKVLCEARLVSTPSVNFEKGGRRTYTEYLLISSFLIRARLNRIKKAIHWIHDEALA